MATQFSRRSIVACIVVIILLATDLWGITSGANAQESSATELTFRFRVPAAYYETVKTNLKFRGTVMPERDAKGLPAAFVFAGVTSLQSLADTIPPLRRKLIQVGIKLDLRGDDVNVDVTRDIPSNAMQIVDKSGVHWIEQDQLKTSADVAAALSKMIVR